MATKTTVHVQYSYLSDQDCSGVLFEIPETEVVGGDQLEMQLWGNSLEILQDYALYKGTASMGAGAISTVEPEPMEEKMFFAESSKFQATYPIHEITSVETITEILHIGSSGNPESWSPPEQLVTDRFHRHVYSCVKPLIDVDLYGSLLLNYTRTPYLKRWYWDIPVGQEGTHWFFIYKNSVLKNKFSIALPDLTEGVTGDKNIIIRVLAKGSNVLVEGAEVYVDDILMGVTNSEGELSIDDLAIGTHALRILAPGYMDTDIDTLYNDQFQVY